VNFDLWFFTFNFELGLYIVKLIERVQYLGQRSFSLIVIVHSNTPATDCTKIVKKYKDLLTVITYLYQCITLVVCFGLGVLATVKPQSTNVCVIFINKIKTRTRIIGLLFWENEYDNYGSPEN